MAYNPPSVGPAGLTIALFPDIQSNLIAQFLGIYGQTSYLGMDAADYQDITIRALQYADANQALSQVWTSLNPLMAIGVALDNIGTLFGTPRKQASNSKADLTLTGTPGAVITNGLAQDQVGNYWTLPTPVTIGSAGTQVATSTCVTPGVVTAAAHTIKTIATPTAGWTSVDNVNAATAGQNIEPDSSYRARLLVSQALPSITLIGGTAAAIAALTGVNRVQVYENPLNTTDPSTSLPPHSIACVVEGGDPLAICQAIYNNKGIGCTTYGTTTRSIADPSNGGISQNISFFAISATSTSTSYVPIFAVYSIHPLNGFTTQTITNIQSDVVNYLNSLQIGEDVYASELTGAALNARPDPDNPIFVIRGITYGRLAMPPTTATLTISSNVITVAAGGGIALGQVCFGAGILPGTTVVLVSGNNITLSSIPTVGGTGIPVSFYTLSSPGADIVIGWNQVAQGISTNITVNLV